MLFLSARDFKNRVLSDHHPYFFPTGADRTDGESEVEKLFTAGAAAAAVLYFALFMRRAGDAGLRILPYETFMFHDMVPILSDVN